MSDEESTSMDDSVNEILNYKDGQLQIVEVTPYDKKLDQASTFITQDQDQEEDAILNLDGSSNLKYVQLLDTKSLVQLDSLNLALVKCSDGGQESYQLVSSADSGLGGGVACVLQSSDGEGTDTDNHEYVMMVGDQDLVLVESISRSPSPSPTPTPVPLTPAVLEAPVEIPIIPAKVEAPVESTAGVSAHELMERYRGLQRARAIAAEHQSVRVGHRGRRRRGLPPPREILSAPGFRLHLYCCKLCNFKCNAIKELTQHRASAHSNSQQGRVRLPYVSTKPPLQCARCPFRASAHLQLLKHLEDCHQDGKVSTKDKNEDELVVGM